jgi:hypothetical protein
MSSRRTRFQIFSASSITLVDSAFEGLKSSFMAAGCSPWTPQASLPPRPATACEARRRYT